MKDIIPIVYTTDGPECTQLQVWGINDNYISQCSFGWHLLTVEGELVDSGQLVCNGDDYAGWDGNRDFPYTWVAANLSNPVTII